MITSNSTLPNLKLDKNNIFISDIASSLIIDLINQDNQQTMLQLTIVDKNNNSYVLDFEVKENSLTFLGYS
jgi:hypothetical protein